MESLTDIPHISKGKKENVRRRKRGEEKHRIKHHQPARDGNSKKFIIGGCVLLCIVSVIVIVIVLVSENSNSNSSDEIQTQFTGRIELVELDQEFVNWNEEMKDITSLEAKGLIAKITPKIKSAYEKEGFQLSNVIVDTLTANAPKSITRNEPSQSLGRAFLQTEVEEKKYDNVQTINIGYKTQGTAKSNAVMVSSIGPGRWEKVREGLEKRLAREGINGKLSSANVVPDFLSSVSKVISDDPVNVELPLSDEPETEECGCDAVYKVDIVCKCSSSCSDDTVVILGGKDNYFSTHSKLCVSAYYAGLIKGSGGDFEVLSQGKFDRLEKGANRRGFVPHGINWRLSVILLKDTGTAIKPTLPTDPSSTVAPNPLQFNEAGMFLINVQYTKLADESIVYHSELRDIESELSTALKNKLEPVFLSATKKQGFKEVSVKFVNFARAPSNNGVIISARLYSTDNSAAQVAVALEKKSPKRLKQLLKSAFPPNDINTVIGFRYSQKFIEEMKKV